MGLLAWGEAIRKLTIFSLSSLEIVGLLLTLSVIVYCTPKFFIVIYKLWIAPACRKNVNFLKMGEWAH
ncbi:unnamed protein product [Allacma fusca]|uniref:Uncharacterized protein n=1 Tax=Allacma fusca TaxID=39272 RepID=A0A8J2P8N3_9HEXA|nr:unnamed protein product [Allacma fusca]